VANDRIHMKCRGCGDTLMLAKFYPADFGVWYPDMVSKWIELHIPCSVDRYASDLGGERCFDLFAESDPDAEQLLQNSTAFQEAWRRRGKSTV